MTVPMYRVAGITHLSKNVRYPLTDGIGDGITFYVNDAHARAKILAEKISRRHAGSTVIDIPNVNPINTTSLDFIRHLKVIDGSTNKDIADFFVYPIQTYYDSTYVYNYRGMNYNEETHEIVESGFVFGYASTLFEALMFIDSFLFACDLQQGNKEEPV